MTRSLCGPPPMRQPTGSAVLGLSLGVDRGDCDTAHTAKDNPHTRGWRRARHALAHLCARRWAKPPGRRLECQREIGLAVVCGGANGRFGALPPKPLPGPPQAAPTRQPQKAGDARRGARSTTSPSAAATRGTRTACQGRDRSATRWEVWMGTRTAAADHRRAAGEPRRGVMSGARTTTMRAVVAGRRLGPVMRHPRAPRRTCGSEGAAMPTRCTLP